jgi:hypothetical protein
LIKMITELGSLELEPTMEVVAVTDARIKRASSAYLPQTSPHWMNMKTCRPDPTPVGPIVDEVKYPRFVLPPLRVDCW